MGVIQDRPDLIVQQVYAIIQVCGGAIKSQSDGVVKDVHTTLWSIWDKLIRYNRNGPTYEKESNVTVPEANACGQGAWSAWQ